MSKKGSPLKQDKSKDKIPQAAEPNLVDHERDNINSTYQEPPRSPVNQISPDHSPSQFDKTGDIENESEPQQIPTDKDELIEFLKFQLMKSQNTINEAFGVFIEQKEATGQLVAEFDAKRRQLTNIQKDTNRPLREKIHEKIEQALEKAVGEKVEAENKRNELRIAIEEKLMMKRELAFTLRLLQAENEQKEKELETLVAKNKEYETLITELSTTKTDCENDGVQKSSEIVRLREEKHDMRGVMRKLSDVKHVLNRLFANPDLLYTKEKTLEGLSKEILPTIKKDMTSPLSQVATSRLGPAPINKPKYLVNEDDFWYADNPLEDYARDYGGREHNYNEKYSYNTKLQNKHQNNENIDTEQPRYSSPTTTLPQISGAKPQKQP